ncbi:MAG: site-2 protease family protein, partial [Thermoleophilia bacterium]|nr:site-2 protease family protein [Thermoleophilia bacterium]
MLLALLIWTLSEGIFPSTNPGIDDAAYFPMAVVAALLFFASILLHELGHAVQARRDGMEIDGITLWLFGGVARFTGMFPSAGAEFRIAVAGPMVSLALGGAFVGLGAVPGLPEPVEAVCAWLGFINLALLVFNLLPALPLDGGRVLRAALWARAGDFARATRQAAGAGRVLSYVLIGLGIAMFVFQGTFSGAWLAFIGWFLLQASAAESRALLARAALEGLRVRDLMVADPVTASPDLSLGDFMDRTVWTHRFTTYPVVDDGRAVGLIPFRCVAEVPREDWAVRRVADCMVPTARVAVVAPDDDLTDALALLQESELNRALVLVGDRLVGLLSITDVVRALELRGM